LSRDWGMRAIGLLVQVRGEGLADRAVNGYPRYIVLPGMKMMSQDNFSSGFLLGSVIGSIIGGVVGALLVSRREIDALSQLSEAEQNSPEPLPRKPSRLKLPTTEGLRMEAARQGLDEKIAQLNEAIDDVRLQLGYVDANRKGDQGLSGQPTNGEVF